MFMLELLSTSTTCSSKHVNVYCAVFGPSYGTCCSATHPRSFHATVNTGLSDPFALWFPYQIILVWYSFQHFLYAKQDYLTELYIRNDHILLYRYPDLCVSYNKLPFCNSDHCPYCWRFKFLNIA